MNDIFNFNLMLELILILPKRMLMLIMILSKKELMLIMILSKRKVMLIMISSKRKVWVPFVCITSDLNTPPSIQMPAARRYVEDNANNTKEITLANKKYNHPHHEEENGEETRNHSFTSYANPPAFRLRKILRPFCSDFFGHL